MAERRKRIMKRLLMEELERRTMFDASFPAMAATGLTDNSYEDFYKSQVGTEIGGPAGVGMLDVALTVNQGIFITMPGTMPAGSNSYGFDASSGVGQMLLTTGANTLGIGSFATPTAGPSRAGGTGNAALGGTIDPGAADQALSELVSELPSLASTKAEGLPKRVKAASAEPVETLSRQLDHEADRVEELFALAESR
jgi:hypothetical protein